MRPRKTVTKYGYDKATSEAMSGQSHLSEMREQLRQALQQLEQHKLSYELENQRRVLLESQCQQMRQQNEQIRSEFQKLKREYGKVSKRYCKAKQSKNCEKCKVDKEQRENMERERGIFIKERNILKNEIKELNYTIEVMEGKGEPKLATALDHTSKELTHTCRVIEEQKRIIRFMDEKLSIFEIESLQTLRYIESIDHELQKLKMQNTILKGMPRRDNYSPSRQNGSIKNLQRLDHSRRTKSREHV